MKKTDGIDVRETPTVISDSGMVRIGDLSTALPSVRNRPANIGDTGKVRIGNMSPAFPLVRPLVRGMPITVSDTGEVRIGEYSAASNSATTADEPNIRIAAVSPTFAPVRSR